MEKRNEYYLSEQMTREVPYLIPPGNEAAASTASRSAGRNSLRRDRAAFLFGIRSIVPYITCHHPSTNKFISIMGSSLYCPFQYATLSCSDQSTEIGIYKKYAHIA